MKRTRYKSPPCGDRNKFTKLYQKAAILNKEIAAFFCSTRFGFLSEIILNKAGILHKQSSDKPIDWQCYIAKYP